MADVDIRQNALAILKEPKESEKLSSSLIVLLPLLEHLKAVKHHNDSRAKPKCDKGDAKPGDRKDVSRTKQVEQANALIAALAGDHQEIGQHLFGKHIKHVLCEGVEDEGNPDPRRRDLAKFENPTRLDAVRYSCAVRDLARDCSTQCKTFKSKSKASYSRNVGYEHWHISNGTKLNKIEALIPGSAPVIAQNRTELHNLSIGAVKCVVDLLLLAKDVKCPPHAYTVICLIEGMDPSFRDSLRMYGEVHEPREKSFVKRAMQAKRKPRDEDAGISAKRTRHRDSNTTCSTKDLIPISRPTPYHNANSGQGEAMDGCHRSTGLQIQEQGSSDITERPTPCNTTGSIPTLTSRPDEPANCDRMMDRFSTSGNGMIFF